MTNFGDSMIIICREVDRATGKIAVYPIDAPVDGRLLHMLWLRSRANPELTYYAVLRSVWDSARRDDILHALGKRKNVEERISRLGGITKI